MNFLSIYKWLRGLYHRDKYTIVSASNMNFSYMFFLPILSAIYTCHGKTVCEDRRVDLLLEEMTSLRRSVLALEDTVRRQHDLIDDLIQRNIQQERWIEEIKTTKGTQTEKLEHRLESVETKFKTEYAPFSGSNVTTYPHGSGIIPNRGRITRRSKALILGK